MKKEGSLKIVLSLLVIVLVILISLGGIFVKDKNIMKNILPEYSLGMDLDTNTIIKLEVEKPEETSSENIEVEKTEETTSESAEAEKTEEITIEGTKVEGSESENTENAEGTENTEESASENKEVEKTEETTSANEKENIYTVDNYKKSKEIIEKRLEDSNVNQYTIRLDENSGTMIIEVPSGSYSTVQQLISAGKFEIKITETNEIIGDNNSIKNVSVVKDSSYGSSIGSLVRFNIEFTKEAINKYKDIKNNYIIPTDELGIQTDNNVVVSINGQELKLTETEFLKSAVTGTLPVYYGDYTKDEEVLNATYEAANITKSILNSGTLPLTYTIEYASDIYSNITSFGIISVGAVILGIMFVYLLIKFKLKSIISTVNILGLISTVLLLLRLLKVQISLASLVALVVIAIVQFIYLIKLLNSKKINSKIFNEKTINFTKILIPTFIVAVIIAFANILEISGFGMVMFWGLILFEIYNNILTRAIFTNGKNK